MEKTNHLLLIAIDDYKHHPKLNNSVKDAEDISTILTNLYQFDPDNVYRLYNDQATEETIDEKFIELIGKIKEHDNLIIYYSGHGYYRAEVKSGYWIPADGRPNQVADYISNPNIINYLRQVKAQHVFLIVDSCFSGALVKQLRGDTTAADLRSRRILTSGRLEVVDDGVPGHNSPFALSIIDFLKSNRLKSVGATQLIDYVRRVTHQSTQQGQEPLEGRLDDTVDRGGEFYFERRLSEPEFWQKALDYDTIKAYETYVKVFPDGDHIAEAMEFLQRAKAKKAWNAAVKEDTLDGYNSFLLHYGASGFAPNARAKIESLKRKRALEIAEIARRAQEEEKIEELGRTYRNTYAEAEQAFLNKKYKLARQKLRECEKNYQAGHINFIPEIDRIREKIATCTRHINFIDYHQEALNAYALRDYETAFKLLKLAANLQPQNQEIRQKIKTVERALRSTKIRKVKPARRQTAGRVGVGKGSGGGKRVVVQRPRPAAPRHTGKRIVVQPKGDPLPLPSPEESPALPSKWKRFFSIESLRQAVSGQTKQEHRILGIIGLILLYVLLYIFFEML
jgi:hypothetical protein